MNYLDFIANNKKIKESQSVLNEAFKQKDIDKSLELILKLFKKNINGLVTMCKNPVNVTTGGKKCMSITFAQWENKVAKTVWNFNYLIEGESTEVYSIDFFGGKNAQAAWNEEPGVKSNLSIYTMGSSIAYFLPIVFHVVNEHDWNLTAKEAKNIAKKIAESEQYRYFVGAKEYTIYENLSDDYILDVFNLKVNEASKELNDYRWKKKRERDDAYRKKVNTKSPEDIANWEKINSEYAEILDAIRGGAQTMGDLQLAVKHNIKVTVNDESINKAENEIKTEKEDPEKAFKKMQIYVKSVIKGQQPGCMICGAPGIGKTYRVKQMLKAYGYNEGHNLLTIKANGSPAQLYIEMYGFKEKGNIILIDDADSLVDKKNDQAANLLKAAMDSTSDDEGRLITWKVRGKLLDEEGQPIPKSMYFNAGVIILTNLTMDKLNDAVKSRGFTQNLFFDSEQILGLIKGMLPSLAKERLSMQSKNKAYEFLMKLAEGKTNMQINIRNFVNAAKLYELTSDEDLSEEDVEDMIKEQMKNMAM